MNQKLTKELAKQLMEQEGEVRGIVFKTDEEFILREQGKEALKKLEAELEKMGCPINHREIETMNFYPMGLRIISLLAMRKVLGFSEQDIERMGAEAPKISLVIKLFAKFFFSITKSVEQAPKMWEKHYTVGKFTAESHEKERYIIIRLKELNLHPVFCLYLKGYLSRIVQMVVKAPVSPEEIKCPYKNEKDKFHEYLLRW